MMSDPNGHHDTNALWWWVLLGGLVDYATGAVYTLQPNPLTLTLACNEFAEYGVSPAASQANSESISAESAPRHANRASGRAADWQ